MAIETYERKANFAELESWCYIAKPHDFIEVTEWHNGEGFDVCINSDGEQRCVCLEESITTTKEDS